MKRWLAILGCVLGFTFIAPIASDIQATAKPKSMMCKATGLDGKQSKWKCKAGQKCCFDWLSSKGACVAASSICL